MSDVVINVDDPEVIITDEYSADYDLPISSSTTLGGVKIGDNVNIDSDGTISIPVASADTAGVIKVGANLSIDENGVLSGQAGGSVTIDSALSTVSTNPVQNRVITNTINSLSSEISATQSSFAGLNDDFETLTGTVTTLGTTVASQGNTLNTLSTTVSENIGNISTINSTLSTAISDITNLDTRLNTAEDNITSITNALGQLQGNVDPVLVKDEIVVPYSTIGSAWASGNLTIVRRGFTGVATLALTGNLVLADSTPVSIYQLTGDNIPSYETHGSLITDDGEVLINVLTSGYIAIQNISGSSKTITKLFGTVPIVFV